MKHKNTHIFGEKRLILKMEVPRFRNQDVAEVKKHKEEKGPELDTEHLVKKSNAIIDSHKSQFEDLPEEFNQKFHDEVVKYFLASPGRYEKDSKKGLGWEEFALYREDMVKALDRMVAQYAPSDKDKEKRNKASAAARQSKEEVKKIKPIKDIADIPTDPGEIKNLKVFGEKQKLYQDLNNSLQKESSGIFAAISKFKGKVAEYKNERRGLKAYKRAWAYMFPEDDTERIMLEDGIAWAKLELNETIKKFQEAQKRLKQYGDAMAKKSNEKKQDALKERAERLKEMNQHQQDTEEEKKLRQKKYDQLEKDKGRLQKKRAEITASLNIDVNNESLNKGIDDELNKLSASIFEIADQQVRYASSKKDILKHYEAIFENFDTIDQAVDESILQNNLANAQILKSLTDEKASLDRLDISPPSGVMGMAETILSTGFSVASGAISQSGEYIMDQSRKFQDSINLAYKQKQLSGIQYAALRAISEGTGLAMGFTGNSLEMVGGLVGMVAHPWETFKSIGTLAGRNIETGEWTFKTMGTTWREMLKIISSYDDFSEGRIGLSIGKFIPGIILAIETGGAANAGKIAAIRKFKEIKAAHGLGRALAEGGVTFTESAGTHTLGTIKGIGGRVKDISKKVKASTKIADDLLEAVPEDLIEPIVTEIAPPPKTPPPEGPAPRTPVDEVRNFRDSNTPPPINEPAYRSSPVSNGSMHTELLIEGQTIGRQISTLQRRISESIDDFRPLKKLADEGDAKAIEFISEYRKEMDGDPTAFAEKAANYPKEWHKAMKYMEAERAYMQAIEKLHAINFGDEVLRALAAGVENPAEYLKGILKGSKNIGETEVLEKVINIAFRDGDVEGVTVVKLIEEGHLKATDAVVNMLYRKKVKIPISLYTEEKLDFGIHAIDNMMRSPERVAELEDLVKTHSLGLAEAEKRALGVRIAEMKEVFKNRKELPIVNERIANSTDFVGELRSVIREVAGGEKATKGLKGVLSRLKERDPKAFELIKNSDIQHLVDTECLQAILTGNKTTFIDDVAGKVTGYIGQKIGEGGLGEVFYIAIESPSGKVKIGAAKKIHPGNELDFMAEVHGNDIVTSWNHPNIAKKMYSGRGIMVCETGKNPINLAKSLRGATKAEDHLDALAKVGDGLEEFNRRKYIHGDMKEANVIRYDGVGLNPDGSLAYEIKIIDNTPVKISDIFEGRSWATTPHYAMDSSQIIPLRDKLVSKGLSKHDAEIRVGRAIDAHAYGIMLEEAFEKFFGSEWSKNRALRDLVDDFTTPIKASDPEVFRKGVLKVKRIVQNMKDGVEIGTGPEFRSELKSTGAYRKKPINRQHNQ